LPASQHLNPHLKMNDYAILDETLFVKPRCFGFPKTSTQRSDLPAWRAVL